MISKETYTWVKKLLNRKTANISNKEYDRLVKDYFQEDKTDWFEENDEKKIWDNNKVHQFWQLIRKYVMPKEETEIVLNFEFFVFPKSEIFLKYDPNTESKLPIDFWADKDDFEFDKIVNFSNAKFLGYAWFSTVKFRGSAVFTGAKFGEIDISLSKFHNDVNFNTAIFYSGLSAIQTTFEGRLYLEEVKFSEKVQLSECYFFDNVNFRGSVFEKKSVFDKLIFKAEVNFSSVTFENTNFKDINSVDIKRFLNFEKQYTGAPKLIFTNTFFTNGLIFQNTDLSELSLHNCDVTNVVFSRCNWNDKNNRLKLKSDLPSKSLEKKVKIKNVFDAENHYRQLKKNFDTSKNWELSGKAYVSEMEMRKYRLFWEEKYLQWSVYWFYSTLGGYTQNFIRPLVILLSSIVIFAGIYFYLDFPNHFSYWNFQSVIESSISKSFQKSFDAAFPFFKPVHEYQYWWIRYFQTFFCSTLLAFFILALRKRFKQ